MVKEIKYFCDDKNCKKKLLWNEQYFKLKIEIHEPNMLYSTQTISDLHYCKDCYIKRYK